MADAITQGTEGTTTTPAGEGTGQTAAAAQSGSTERTYTQAEMDAAIEGLFSQADVDGIVKDRLRKERAKYEGYAQYKADAEAHADYDEVVAARDRALADVERLTASAARRDLVDKVSAATGVPGSLLKGETEDELTASAEAVKAYAGSQAPAYPQDKGGGASPSPITRDQIESIKDPVERVRVRAQHIDLYQ